MGKVLRALRSEWLLLVVGLLWVPLVLEITPASGHVPLLPCWILLGVCGLGLLWKTPGDPTRRRVPTARALVLRSALGAVTLGVGTWLHELSGPTLRSPSWRRTCRWSKRGGQGPSARARP